MMHSNNICNTLALTVALTLPTACGDRLVELEQEQMSGESEESGDTEDTCELILFPIYRDFRPLDIDFGCHMAGYEPYEGLVLPELGADGKPQYNPNPPLPPANWEGTFPLITSAESFAGWFNEVPGRNVELYGQIVARETTPGTGVYQYHNASFYPINGLGFGNNTEPNWIGKTYDEINGSFTTEISFEFVYRENEGQSLKLAGDDDIWAYVNGKLAIDLGGLHSAASGRELLLDHPEAAYLGLVDGERYTVHIFHAERCDSGSGLIIETSMPCR